MKPNSELRAEALKLASAGVPPREIATRLNVNRTTIYSWMASGRKLKAAKRFVAKPLLKQPAPLEVHEAPFRAIVFMGWPALGACNYESARGLTRFCLST